MFRNFLCRFPNVIVQLATTQTLGEVHLMRETQGNTTQAAKLDSKKTYNAPTLTKLGNVAEMTQQVTVSVS